MKKPKNIPTYYTSKGTPIFRDTTALPFDGGGNLNQRIVKKYPGMQGVYGPQGENLNIIKDPNYAAADYGFGNIEFIFPGSGTVNYSDDYTYQSPTPDKYTAVYNPKGANKHDVFLDMMHGMRNDPEYMKLLDSFDKATRGQHQENMDYFFNKDTEENPDYTADGREMWDQNYVDSQLRSQLAGKGFGRFSSGAKDYKLDRKYSSPEMEQSAKDIYKYLKGNKKQFADGGHLHDRDINGKLLQSTYASALGNMFREGGPFGEDQGVFDYATSIYASQPGNYYAQGGMIKRADGSYSQRGLWDNIRAAAARNRTAGKPGKEPSKEMLRQGEKINREYRTGGQFPRPYSLPEDSFKQGGTNLHNSVYASSSAPYPGIYAEGGTLLPPDNAPAGTPFNLANRNSWMGDYSMIPQGHDLSLPLTSLPGIGNQITSGAATANFKTVGDYVTAAENWERNRAGSPIAPGPVNINAVIPSTPPIPEVAKTNYYTDPYTGQVVKDFNPVTGVATPREIPNSFGNTQYSSYLEKVANSPAAKENQQALEAERLNNIELLKTMTPEQKAAMRAAGLTPAQYLADPFSAGATKFAEGGELVVAGGEKHRIYKKTSPTGNGEGMEGHIMVNHPTMDKGQWDTIDLTTKAGAKTVADGIAATKQWHKENPNVYRDGGSVFYASNTPQLEGEGKDLTYPDGAYVYGRGGVIKTSQLFAGGGPIFPTNQQLAQFLNPEYQRVTQGQEVTVRPNAYQLQQAKNKAAGINKYDAINIKPQVAESTKPNIASVDKKVLDKAIAQKTAERKVVAKEIKNSPLLTQEQKQEILMSPEKLDENAYLAYQRKPNVLKAAKEYTAADKATNILRNPLVAASYFMKPGAFNMPMNYSEFERSPNYSDETWNRNAVGQGLNFASYLNPTGLALHMADNALYTGTDLDKALESGKAEDWKKAGLSAANTALDLVGSRYIGGSGRLLNVGEQATLNAMNISNRLGLNPSVNNFLSTRVFPNINSSVVRSADDIAAARLFPQINPNNINYNPLARNLYNNAVTAGNAQNTLESIKDLGLFNHDINLNPNIVYKESPSTKIIPFNNESGKSLQAEYIEELKDYYNSSEFKRIMKEEYPDVDIEKYKKATLENLEKELEYNPSAVPDNASGVYTTKHSSNAAYMPGYSPTFKQRVANANTNPYMYEGDRGTSQINDPVASWHELSHQRTNSDELLPDWLTRSLLEENSGIDASNLEYYAKPTEFDVRMKQLKKDLKAQGIHDYFKGPVTEEHIRQLDAANLKEHGDFLFRNMTDEYRKLKKSGASLEELDSVKDKFYNDIENLEKKVGTLKTSQDTQDLLQRWDTEFLAKMAKRIPVVVGGAYLGNELLQNNRLEQSPSGQFKMGGQARVIKSSQLFNR